MPDDEDIKLLKSGATDLTKCDFRGADLSGLDLREKNFNGAFFDKARAHNTDFSKSSFIGAHFAGFDAAGANFSDCNINAMTYGHTNFLGANLTRAIAGQRPFIKCIFKNATLIGTNFQNTIFLQDNQFENSITDETTNFQGAQIPRATARQYAFRYYEYKGGILVRKAIPDSDSSAVSSTEHSIEKHEEKTDEFNKNVDAFKVELISNPHKAASETQILSILVAEEIRRLRDSRPNEVAQIESRDRAIEFLEDVSTRISNIERILRDLGESANSSDLDKAVHDINDVGDGLRKSLEKWVADTLPIAVPGALNVGIIGILGVYLVTLGCPPFLSFGIATASLAGKRPYDALIEIISKVRGARNGTSGE